MSLSSIAVHLLLSLMLAGPVAEIERRYTFSPSGNDEILCMYWEGGSSWTHQFLLYGDGRLHGSDRWPASIPCVPEKPVELWLTPAQVVDILDTVVDAGLIEFGPVEARRRLQRLQPTPEPGKPVLTRSLTSEHAALALRISLASYEGPKRTEPGAFVLTTGVNQPAFISRLYREELADTYIEAEALLHLYHYLDELAYGPKNR